MTGTQRQVLRVLVDDRVRREIAEHGRNPLSQGRDMVEDDVEGRALSRVPLQRQSRHSVFVAYSQYEGVPDETLG